MKTLLSLIALLTTTAFAQTSLPPEPPHPIFGDPNDPNDDILPKNYDPSVPPPYPIVAEGNCIVYDSMCRFDVECCPGLKCMEDVVNYKEKGWRRCS